MERCFIDERIDICFLKDHDDDLSPMSQVPQSNGFSFGNYNAHQTVPDNNSNQNNLHFQF